RGPVCCAGDRDTRSSPAAQDVNRGRAGGDSMTTSRAAVMKAPGPIAVPEAGAPEPHGVDTAMTVLGRLKAAGEFGADLTLDVSATDAAERAAAVRAATDGPGADIVIDCSGFPATFTESLDRFRTGGVVVEAGTFVDMGPVTVNPNSAICTAQSGDALQV